MPLPQARNRPRPILLPPERPAECGLCTLHRDDTMKAPGHEFLERKDLMGETARGIWAPRSGAEQEVSSLPRAAAPQLHSLLQFWNDAGGSDAIPHRGQLEFFALRPWLGHISIYEANPGGADYRIRLEGTKIVAITGEDWTGKRASDVDHRYGSRLVEFMRNVIASGKPAIHTMRLFQNDVEFVTRLLLPVRARADGPVDQVFLVIYADPNLD
jgi:hypothetical protein